jgi:hypothetical protein
MLGLPAMKFRNTAYGSARKTQLKKLDLTHRWRIALGTFCINRTQNLLTEAEEITLQQRIKTANVVVKKTEKPEKNNRYLRNRKMYDQY